ncbi:uncharacterized protein EDB91DRAFT_1170588, partial [Suillus paluster]|uniref:uncharacterized protein n=1 Tax=Suillus paluster TaxID=48578 RepID=UPI001B872C4C
MKFKKLVMKVLMHKSKADRVSSVSSPIPSHSDVSSVNPIPPEPLPPIHQLPMELLQVIFLLIVNDDTYSPNIFSTGRNSTWANFSSPPLLFTCVCRRWRDVAHLTPGIWSRISVILPRLLVEPSSPLLPNLLQSWLDRSASHPLTIHVQGPSSQSDIDYYVDPSSANSRLLEILMAEMGRWEILFGASDLFDRRDTFDTPQLKMLECTSPYVPKVNAPNLHRLRIVDQLLAAVQFTSNPTCTNIRHLYLRNASAGAIRSFSAIFPRLETLVVDELAPQFGDISRSDTFPCLETMTLPMYHHYHGDAFIDIFIGLRVPMLQKLNVEGKPATKEVESVMMALAGAASRTIRAVDFVPTMRYDKVEEITVQPLLLVVREVAVRGEVIVRREVIAPFRGIGL